MQWEVYGNDGHEWKSGWDVVGSIIFIQVSIFVYKAIDANVFSSMQAFWLNWSHAESGYKQFVQSKGFELRLEFGNVRGFRPKTSGKALKKCGGVLWNGKQRYRLCLLTTAFLLSTTQNPMDTLEVLTKY